MDSLQEKLDNLTINKGRIANSNVWKWLLNLDTSLPPPKEN